MSFALAIKKRSNPEDLPVQVNFSRLRHSEPTRFFGLSPVQERFERVNRKRLAE